MAPLLSIAIEDTAIKFLAVDGNRINKAVSLPLEPGLVKDGVVLDKAAVSQKIRQFLNTEKITPQKVLASVSGVHSLYRLISLPRLPDDLLQDAVKRETERTLPVPSEELYLSWQAIPFSAEETLVCAVDLPKDTVNSVIATLRQAGLEPSVMDARPLAAARACSESRAIVINTEATDFDIVIIINGIPELVRSLAFSEDSLYPEDKAVEIRRELERTVYFYNTSHEAAPIPTNMPVILGGEVEIVSALNQELSRPVRPLTISLPSPEDLNVTEFMTNIGLVLKAIKTDQTPLRLNLNTLPEVYLPKPVPILPFLSWILVFAAIVLLVWLGILTRGAIAETSHLQAQLSQAQALIKPLQPEPKKLAELEARFKQVTMSRDTLKTILASLEQQRARVSSDLNTATSLLPTNITLTNISHGTVLTIKGTAPDDKTILSYVRRLKETGRFSQVLVSFDTRAYQEVSFTLTLK